MTTWAPPTRYRVGTVLRPDLDSIFWKRRDEHLRVVIVGAPKIWAAHMQTAVIIRATPDGSIRRDIGSVIHVNAQSGWLVC